MASQSSLWLPLSRLLYLSCQRARRYALSTPRVASALCPSAPSAPWARLTWTCRHLLYLESFPLIYTPSKSFQKVLKKLWVPFQLLLLHNTFPPNPESWNNHFTLLIGSRVGGNQWSHHSGSLSEILLFWSICTSKETSTPWFKLSDSMPLGFRFGPLLLAWIGSNQILDGQRNPSYWVWYVNQRLICPLVTDDVLGIYRGSNLFYLF